MARRRLRRVGRELGFESLSDEQAGLRAFPLRARLCDRSSEGGLSTSVKVPRLREGFGLTLSKFELVRLNRTSCSCG